jgi:RNA polymerase sigma-70 factor, ECF subfamily
MLGFHDKDQFEALARPHLDALYRTALRMVSHPATAEDMVQETCLRAFAALDPHSYKTNFRAWLFRILVNLSIDHIRGISRQATVSGAFVDNVATCAPDPEQLAMSSGLRDDIRAAVDVLPAELRLVVLLVLVEEMSYAEAAECLDVPVGTVRSRLNRARSQLQSLLKDHAQGPKRATRPLKVALT